MQFAYLFPERCERLVLVSSGGLGRELSILLRAGVGVRPHVSGRVRPHVSVGRRRDHAIGTPPEAS
jgi:pimeloyl-ACP methyl ester carboxylesterase